MAMGIGLAGSGLLIFYYLGAMSVLQKQGEALVLSGWVLAAAAAAQELTAAACCLPVALVIQDCCSQARHPWEASQVVASQPCKHVRVCPLSSSSLPFRGC
jgi:hypothetical protein